MKTTGRLGLCALVVLCLIVSWYYNTRQLNAMDAAMETIRILREGCEATLEVKP